MKFEYNENLDFIERIELVALEIKKQYPNIDDSAIVMPSLLTSSIDDKPTNDEKFERYYYILNFLNPSNIEYLHVFNDLCDVYEDGIKKEQYNNCMIEIIKYVSKERDTFPNLVEFYN